METTWEPLSEALSQQPREGKGQAQGHTAGSWAGGGSQVPSIFECPGLKLCSGQWTGHLGHEMVHELGYGVAYSK